MTDKLKAVSLFSGCGGFDWGAKEAGVEIIWANDIDIHASAAYRGLFPEVNFEEGDIRDFDSFPEAPILIGCYPCTGFSVASRRRAPGMKERNLKANNSNFLYKEFLRALKHVNPSYLFVENVPGMSSAANGWFLDEQIQGFEEAGYHVFGPKLLLASEYGAAQARKRLFFVGVRKDIFDFTYIFKQPTHGPQRQNKYKVLRDVIGGMELWPINEYHDYKFHGHYLTRNRKRGWNELSFTIVANASHVPLHPMGAPMVNVGKDEWKLQGEENRRLSWRECAVIQGLPDHVEPSGSLRQKYRVIGNAVPPVFGKALLEPVVAHESKK